MEAKDEEVLANPQSAILDPGGRVLFAVHGGEIVGCCALLAMGPGEFEVAKMAVAESSRRIGAGRRLLTEAIETARALGARRLYESMGFHHLPPERVTPSDGAGVDERRVMRHGGAGAGWGTLEPAILVAP
jgi:GNAT superfamily N-acetyltransferase